MKSFLNRINANRVTVFLGILAFVFPAALVLAHSPATSPIDEWVFIDYTSKVLEQGYVHEGERVGSYTAELMACEGVLPGATFGECGAGESNYQALPYTGLTAAAAYTPVYFFATRVMGIPFELLGFDQLIAWRLTGAVWLSAGILMFIALLRFWGISNRKIIPLALLVIASPFVWWAHTFVSTDAPSILVGAGILFAVSKIVRKQLSYWWLLLIFPIATALKVTNLVSVGLGVVFIVGAQIYNYLEHRKKKSLQFFAPSYTKASLVAIFSTLFAVAVQVGWARFISLTAVSAERVDQGISMQLTPTELAWQVVNFLPSVLSYSAFSGHGKDFIWIPLSWIPIAGVIGSFFLLRGFEKKTNIVVSVLIASLFMAPLLAIAVQIAQGAYFQLSPRYGASLIPAFLLCAAFILRNGWARNLLSAYAVLLMGAGIYAGMTLV